MVARFFVQHVNTSNFRNWRYADVDPHIVHSIRLIISINCAIVLLCMRQISAIDITDNITDSESMKRKKTNMNYGYFNGFVSLRMVQAWTNDERKQENHRAKKKVDKLTHKTKLKPIKVFLLRA